MRLLDLGCGSTKTPGATGIDIAPMAGVDVIADLRRGIPVKDGVADEVRCTHLLEHLPDLVSFMEEVHRVLKPGGIMRVRVPYFTSNYAFADPTHLRFFSYSTFDYFSPVSNFQYSWARFRVLEKRLKFAHGRLQLLGKIIDPLTNRFPRLYERLFAHILPSDELRVVLQAVE